MWRDVTGSYTRLLIPHLPRYLYFVSLSDPSSSEQSRELANWEEPSTLTTGIVGGRWKVATPGR